MKRWLGVLAMVMIIWPFAFTQEVKTTVKLYDDLFFTEAGLIPLPERAIEITLESVISSDLFTAPLLLDSDREGNIYVLPKGADTVYKFNQAGELLSFLGKKVLKEGSLLKISEDNLIIYDSAQKKLIVTDLNGMSVKSWKLLDVDDAIVLLQKNQLYAAHYIRDKSNKLISFYYDKEGKFEFGSPFLFPHSLDELNSRKIAVDDEGNIFVAFRYLAEVRKYSSSGKLIAAYKIETPVLKVKEEFNLKAVGEGIANPIRRIGWKPLLISMKLFGDRVFLLTHYPRLEILEVNGDGILKADYWKDFEEPFEVNDFAVLENEGRMKFLVSRSKPPVYDILLFSPKDYKANHRP